MKGIIRIILLFSLSMVIYGCTGGNKTPFEKFVNEVPSSINKDYVLPSQFNFEEIEWFLNGEKLEDNKIAFYYTDVDVTASLTAKIKDETVNREIKIAKTNFVTNLSIDTVYNQPIVSKEDYVRAELKLSNAGAFNTTIESFRIRGRGNSTWGYSKKPYRLKFDERVSILGMKPGKDYVLLAEHNDKTLMRNYVAHYLSQYLNLPHTLETRYISLTLNGYYQGLYLLTEQVKVEKTRLNIDESEDLDGGFLLEMERDYERTIAEGDEDLHWFRIENPNPYDRFKEGDINKHIDMYYVVKSPDMEDYSSEIVAGKLDYMKKYIRDFQASVETDTYDEYIDVDNFIDYFMLSEFMKQVDVGMSSVYITKDKGGKMQMGPIWDFDISSGNGNYYAYGPKGFWADYHPWFAILMKRPEFQQKFIARFNEFMELYFDKMVLEIERVEKLISFEANRNFIKWTMHPIDGWNPNPNEMLAIHTHAGQVDYFVDYLTKRKNWIIQTLNTKGYIGYLLNNDEGWDK